ncbi:MAG: transglutaminase-like cysteine peptidase [Syntrophus sp. (in: bacteria)]
MGAATIVSGGPTGLYSILLVQETTKATARLKVIKDLIDGTNGNPLHSPPILATNGLTTAIIAATGALTVAEVALSTASALLEDAIEQSNTPIPSLEAVPRWYNVGKGTCTKVSPGPSCQAGNYSITFGAFIAGDYGTSPVIPDSTGFTVSSPTGSLPVAKLGSYVSSGINFTTTEGDPAFSSGDSFDIIVTDESKVVATPTTEAMKAVYAAQTDLIVKRRALATLRLEKASLEKEQALITKALLPVTRTGIWCADLTEDMAAGKAVGTIEINGEEASMNIMPGGKVGLGKLEPVLSSTPAGVFVNMATLPCWQKWKPTYRVGEIKVMGPVAGQCSVCLDEAFSAAQGLKINQDGTLCSQALAPDIVSGFADFCRTNPSDPLVSNTADSKITSSAQLLADLAAVNKAVNSSYTYKKDVDQYGTLEKWNYMEPGASGDCEDFALTKARMLLAKGYPASAIKIEVGKTSTGAGHAWLTVQTDKGDLSLDLNYSEVMPAGMLNYTSRYRQTGCSWSRQGVLLSNVPIDYMDGSNENAFEVGDRVIVSFTGQVWAVPKVIGFESHPRLGLGLYINQTGFHNQLVMGKYTVSGVVKDAAFLNISDWWGFPYSIFEGDIYLPREMKEGEGTPWQDCLLVRVYNLKTKVLKRTIPLHFFHIPAFVGDNAAMFRFSSSPLGGGGVGAITHSVTGTLYVPCTWYTFQVGYFAWIRTGVYAFNHLTGSDMGSYQHTGCRYGLPGGGQPGPIQQ